MIAATSEPMARAGAVCARLLLAAAFLVLPALAHAAELTLKPFKDELFAYPGIIASEDGGAYRVVDYSEARDIDRRDKVPERRVHAKYVSTGVRKMQQDLALKTDAGTIRFVAVGKTDGARVITIYLHGQGGSRKQGVDDYTFGGNFNRIKNLMADNGGLYLSPDFSDFGAGGTAEIAALIGHYAEKSPGAPVFVACGSMGGALCWSLANDKAVAPRLSGLLLLGSLWDDGFTSSAAFKRKVPVFFGQGSRDTVFPVDSQEAFYRSILKKAPGYPARFVRFESGTHGTPIRMTDWRETLNWMLSARP
jgi:dienelactone hydrolase